MLKANQIKKLKKLYFEMVSYRKIADTLKCDTTTVFRWVHRLELDKIRRLEHTHEELAKSLYDPDEPRVFGRRGYKIR
jgi:DNA invertase Pin-like site-specific DNA recombinase